MRPSVQINRKILGALVQEATDINTKYTFAKNSKKWRKRTGGEEVFCGSTLCSCYVSSIISLRIECCIFVDVLTILSDNYDKGNKLQYQLFSCIITINCSLRYFIISAFVVLITSQSYNNKNDAQLKSLVEGVSYVIFV